MTGSKNKVFAVKCSSFDNDDNCEELDILVQNPLSGYSSLEVVSTVKEVNYRKVSKRGQKILKTKYSSGNTDLYTYGTRATATGCSVTAVLYVTVPFGVAFNIVKAPVILPYLGITSLVEKAKIKKEFKKMLKFAFDRKNAGKVMKAPGKYLDALTVIARSL